MLCTYYTLCDFGKNYEQRNRRVPEMNSACRCMGAMPLLQKCVGDLEFDWGLKLSFVMPQHAIEVCIQAKVYIFLEKSNRVLYERVSLFDSFWRLKTITLDWNLAEFSAVV